MRTRITTFFAVAFAVSGCGGASTQTHTARHEPPPASDDSHHATVASSGADTGDANCSVSPVYFEFDSADLSPATRDTLVRDARCIQQHPDQPVQLVGATDPRGTEEYNLALGDKRARSVAQYLQSLGVARARVHVTSVGEEESRGSDEHSWAEDRWVKDR